MYMGVKGVMACDMGVMACVYMWSNGMCIYIGSNGMYIWE